jgi:SIR2-like domain
MRSLSPAAAGNHRAMSVGPLPPPDEVTVFVGAGISVPPPTGAPDFRALRNRFLRFADPDLDPERFELDELSPEQVFDAVDDGREELRATVRRELWWLCEPNEPNPNHYATAALLGAGVTVWTPNFDTMIERAAARLSIAVGAVTPGSPVAAPQAGPRLLKPHGTFPYTGDPPREPGGHSYRLLFQASEVWLLDDDWTRLLLDDLEGRDVLVFGYRGADPDLTPIMLRGFERSRSVTWWELPTSRNLPRLERLLDGLAAARVSAGDPSAALQGFAQRMAPHRVPSPRGVALRRPPSLGDVELSHVAKAQMLGQFRGSAAARRHLRRAVLWDPPENRGLALFRLVRSMGFDIPWARQPLLWAVGVALRVPRLRDRPRVAELYATLIDARPIRPGDRRAVRRLLALPGASRSEILVRVASTEKLHGELDAAIAHAHAAMRDIERRRRPRLEAMAVYNLAWIYRQRGDFARRSRLVEQYGDRMPHIGFNWAAWLALDEVLVALHFGDVTRARQLMTSPFLTYARSLIAHRMYRLDDALNAVLLEWHERGPGGIDLRLKEILEANPLRLLRRPPFTAVDTLIVLADHSRAVGDRSGMRGHLRRARRRTCSALQLAEADLVEAAGSLDRGRVVAVRDSAARRGFGLIEQTAEAVLADMAGRAAPTPVVYRQDLPLAGIY